MGQKDVQSAQFEVKESTKLFDHLANFTERDNEQLVQKNGIKETCPRARLYSAHLQLVRQET